MPFISIKESPLLPGASPVEIHYRESGGGAPLVFLHGGWGYEVYPFDRQLEAFAGNFKVTIPDRTGYGRSARIESMPVDFHRRAAVETFRLLESLGINRPVLWGHSDGAVIAALMGLSAPELLSGIIFEAFHFYRVKPGSREFFEAMVRNPDALGERVCAALARDHGEDYWRSIILNNGRSWLKIAEGSSHAKQDLYDGNLSALRAPSILIHGRLDPRTEPDELEAVRRQLDQVPIHIIEGGGHSPHSQASVVDECNAIAGRFLNEFASREF
ncbi:MAG TPA: alpha/beta hydrolase [Blastocatellia bacterium]|jgi:pimeloyl-ACP methyl ester carboxylesterase|nr:alpha/beta hydrolase [Blastocatellia bacterium]